MNNCKDCQHWQKYENRYNRAIDPEHNPVTGDEWASEEEKRQFFPDTVRYCKHPKVVFYQRPDSNGVAVFDGSEYMAYLATGQDYGCVNFEPANVELRGARGFSRVPLEAIVGPQRTLQGDGND